MLLRYVFMFALQSAVLSLGSWEDLTSQFLQDCDHSQALFESSESVADVWNHGFALLVVLYASFNCDNRFTSRICFLSVLKQLFHALNQMLSI